MSKPVHQVFDEAADLLETGGWIKGEYWAEGSYCLAGACKRAEVGYNDSPSEDEEWYQLLADEVGRSPEDWNDEEAEDAEDVIVLLRRMARGYRTTW